MGKFNQFTYWKNGVTITKKEIKQIPKNGVEHLVYYKITNGDYDESPYWNMAHEEQEKFEQECLNWKETNSRASMDAYNHWFIHRRRVYNKKIQKLKESHHDYEILRLKRLKQQFTSDFGIDIFDELILKFDGDLIQFYFYYKQNTRHLNDI